MYYPYSENKGADQLRSYCAADLRLVFAYSKIRFSNDEAHIMSLVSLPSLCSNEGLSESTWLQVYKTFFMLNSTEHEFILIINFENAKFAF